MLGNIRNNGFLQAIGAQQEEETQHRLIRWGRPLSSIFTPPQATPPSLHEVTIGGQMCMEDSAIQKIACFHTYKWGRGVLNGFAAPSERVR